MKTKDVNEMKEMIDNVEVEVLNGDMNEEEMKAYVRYVKDKYPEEIINSVDFNC